MYNTQVQILFEIIEDLSWLASEFKSSSEKSFMECLTWSPSSPDSTLFVDTCSTGNDIQDTDCHVCIFYQFSPPSLHNYLTDPLALVIAVDRSLSKQTDNFMIYSDPFLCFELFSCHNQNPIIQPSFQQTIYSSNRPTQMLNPHHFM